MINLNRLTPDAIHCIDLAVIAARERHNPYLDTEHLLIGALQTDIVIDALKACGISAEALLKETLGQLSVVRDSPIDSLKGITKQASHTLSQASHEAELLGATYLNSGHIALSIFKAPEPFLVEILRDFPSIDIELFVSKLSTATVAPTEVFLQRWRPATWENSKLFSPTLSAKQPITLTFTTSRQLEKNQQKKTESTQNMLPIWIGLGLLLAILYLAFWQPNIIVPVVVVVGGWVISLVLHEFSHALIAYWGGDYTVVEKGYLTLNPLKYMHPLLSIGLPLFFLAIGGIGLPGGAVYIERHRLRNKWWHSAVSIAGPFANLICLIVFSAPFWTGYVNAEHYFARETFWNSLAFLCWLQATAILFNLLPIPPLDGFGMIEPFLPEDFARQMRSFGSMGLMLIILLFWMPSSENSRFNFSQTFFEQADKIVMKFDIHPALSYNGWREFRFWRDD